MNVICEHVLCALFLQCIFEDVMRDGPGAFQKYYNDTELMTKVSCDTEPMTKVGKET